VSGPDGFLSERLDEIVRRFASARVAVVGDVIADQFVYGEISRVSREAPVLILRYETTQTLPGGAGNAAANVAALGGTASLVGLVGRDRAGRSAVLGLRRRGVDTSGVVSLGGHTTPTKTRILAGLPHSLKQQVIRIDHEPPLAATVDAAAALAARAAGAASSADAVIVSDYNYGVAGPEVIGAVREAASSRGIPILVDSRFLLARFTGFASATPNESELEAHVGRSLASEADIVEAGAQVLAAQGFESLLVTRGSRGMLLFERGGEMTRIPAVGASDAIDVTGAGDTVIATFALALAARATYVEAAHLANHAGGLVVMKRGTATISADELRASVESWASPEG
jgi:rfaE bifunctional protein kinase chain/domain